MSWRPHRPRGSCIALGLVLAVATGTGCSPLNGGEPIVQPPRIRDGAGLVFTFFDRSAQMRTVERIASVEPEARGAVMVTDPRSPLEDDAVFVADLSKRDPEGAYRVWVESRGHWLDRVMPRATVLEAVAAAPRPRKRRAKRARSAPKQRKSAGNRTVRADPQQASAASAQRAAAAAAPKVVVFGTTWCPSCRLARQYFQQRRIRFLDIDVEKNQEAAQRMLAIQQAKGLKPGAVPLIVVNGRVYQGFSRLQLDAAVANMGAPTAVN